MWTYRGTFGVTEVDLNGNAGPGYDKLKSFKFGGINAAYGASIFSLWLTSDGNGSRFQLIASMDAGYEKSDKMRYNYMLSNDVRAQTHLGDFPWYLNMQIDIRNDNLAIYYLNKKQHDLRIPPGKARVETNSYKAFVYVGSDGGIEHGRIRDISVVSNDPFVSNSVTCGNGSICVKQESEAQCCRNTCTSIGDIKSFCGAWVPKNLTSLSTLLCKGSVCIQADDRSICCEPPHATCSSVLSPRAFCLQNSNCDRFNGWSCGKLTTCGSYGKICGGFNVKVRHKAYFSNRFLIQIYK